MDSVRQIADDLVRPATMGCPDVSVIAPSYNERSNIRPLVAAIAETLDSVEWELIIVDDDSPDGTYREILEVAKSNPRVRGLRRVGRKGLSSAVIEGILASSAPVVVVMDADLQHDESVLPDMLAEIARGADLVIGTRYSHGGSLGDLSEDRARMSRFATRVASVLVGKTITDPMSGFFMARREVVNNAIYDLSQQGYKILLDLLASAPPSTRIVEVPYTFRPRVSGDSKLTMMVLAEFLFLMIEKLSRGLVPPRFMLFGLVGSLGLIIHLAVLNLAAAFESTFVEAQVTATIAAMVFNFVLNNEFTFRDRRLTGPAWIVGLVLFMLTCSIGALANVSVADLVQREIGSWNIAGLLGALMGAVFNFGVASSLVWTRRKARRIPDPATST